MFYGNFLRDAQFLDLDRVIGRYPAGRASNLSPSVSYSQLVHSQQADAYARQTLDLAADQHAGVGVVMDGPVYQPGQFTPYRVHGSAVSFSAGVIPVFGYGVAPVTLGGIAIIPAEWRVVRTGSAAGLDLDELINIRSFDAAERARAIVFAIVFMSGSSDPEEAMCIANLSVQRLVGPAPATIDRRKG